MEASSLGGAGHKHLHYLLTNTDICQLGVCVAEVWCDLEGLWWKYF